MAKVKADPLEEKKQFIKLRASGLSYDKIIKEMGKAKSTLLKWGRELQEEISTARSIELEAMYEEYGLLREQRIRSHGQILKRVREEIEGRELSEVPTPRLMELYLKQESQVSLDLEKLSFLDNEVMLNDKRRRVSWEDLGDYRWKPKED
jgi:transposase-like protein